MHPRPRLRVRRQSPRLHRKPPKLTLPRKETTSHFDFAAQILLSLVTRHMPLL
jgi:hypothetical protein